jgi:hypothetical protein
MVALTPKCLFSNKFFSGGGGGREGGEVIVLFFNYINWILFLSFMGGKFNKKYIKKF